MFVGAIDDGPFQVRHFQNPEVVATVPGLLQFYLQNLLARWIVLEVEVCAIDCDTRGTAELVASQSREASLEFDISGGWHGCSFPRVRDVSWGERKDREKPYWAEIEGICSCRCKRFVDYSSVSRLAHLVFQRNGLQHTVCLVAVHAHLLCPLDIRDIVKNYHREYIFR